LSLFNHGARPFPVGPFVCLLLIAAGCSDGGVGGDASNAAAMSATRVSAPDERVFTELGDFLNRFWLRPVPAQGPAPEHFDSLAASLHPETCGRCHQAQYEDWQTTIHSRAYSPGLSGQLVNWSASDPATVQSCQVCHTPLSEQIAQLRDTDGEFVANPDFDPALRNQGLVCAACHLRGNRRYGPPRRDGSLQPSAPLGVHGGVTARTTYFEDSRFCATCHQFAAPAPNGKSLQNTHEEWEQSRYAAEGVPCQGCHMPDRRHLWRGIHDPDMVASGVTIEWVPPAGAEDPAGAVVELRLTNTGTGHHFPTYVTPEVVVELWLEDESGATLIDSETTSTIGRRVKFEAGQWVEVADTRIPADSSYSVTTSTTGSAARAHARVRVHPDEFYRGMFEGMLNWNLSDTSLALIAEAHEDARSSPFVIFEEVLDLRSGRVLQEEVGPAAVDEADAVVGVAAALDVGAVPRASQP
jgi:hypothetical protein